jgi:hypothetical protein
MKHNHPLRIGIEMANANEMTVPLVSQGRRALLFCDPCEKSDTIFKTAALSA